MKIFQISLDCTRDTADASVPESAFRLYIFKKPAVCTINGCETNVSENSAMILGAGCKRNFRFSSQKKIRFDCISFCPSAADRQFMTSVKMPVNTPIRIKDEFSVLSSVKEIKNHFVCHGVYADTLIELHMKIIFVMISEFHTGGREKKDRLIPRYSDLKKLRHSIYENPSSEWNAEDISLKLGMSRSYLHRLYTEAFGVTFIRDVIESRLLRSCELLTSTDLSVSAIAEKCGYENDSYFMRQFKKYKNCTPSEYRKIADNNTDDNED